MSTIFLIFFDFFEKNKILEKSVVSGDRIVFREQIYRISLTESPCADKIECEKTQAFLKRGKTAPAISSLHIITLKEKIQKEDYYAKSETLFSRR